MLLGEAAEGFAKGDEECVRYIPLTQGKFAIVDAADYERLAAYKWHAKRDRRGRTWYAARNTIRNGKRQTERMHRVILDALPGVPVDHRSGDGLDNRRANLRTASLLENAWNRGPMRCNKSGYVGVHWHKYRRKWTAASQVDSKRVTLGYYDIPEDAARAYNDFVVATRGEFARLNEVPR